MKKTYTYAIFETPERAHEAIDALDDEFQARKIDVLLQDPKEGRTQEVPLRQRTSVGVGIAVGAAFGAIALAVVALATTLFSANPWLAALDGLLIGSFAGGLVGAVGGLGHWRTKPAMPDEVSDASTIMVGVATDHERVPTVQRTLARVGANQISILEGDRTAQAA